MGESPNKRNNCKGLHIFRRDIRLTDNLNIEKLASMVDVIYPVFICTKKQLLDNPLFNPNTLGFLDAALQALGDNVTVCADWGQESELDFILGLVKLLEITHVSFMSDYTMYSRNRDRTLIAALIELNINVISIEDTMLVPISAGVVTGSGKPYQKFTPYYNAAKTLPVKLPVTKPIKTVLSTVPMAVLKKLGTDNLSLADKLKQYNLSIGLPIGWTFNPTSVINRIKRGDYAKYGTAREDPSDENGTTRMGAYLKYGVISVRTAYMAVNSRDNEPLLRQLYWRDFYYYISAHYPHVLAGFNYSNSNKNSTKNNRNFNKVVYAWPPVNKSWLKCWQEGTTGIPIVDAGMRQMNATGWMHNRLRMIVSNFLVKDLHIDWQEGERYFAQCLVDYDPAQNNGGWQWSSGTGVDSQPYFRVFNPWRQSAEHDPECKYIKRWIPELKDVPPQIIHNWNVTHSDYNLDQIDYPAPIIQHDVQKKIFLDRVVRKE